jgi:cell division protease FtsH
VTLAPRENPYLPGGDGFAGFGASKPYSEETAELIDSEVHRILQECYDEGVRLLRQHRAQLDALAQALLEHETLDEQEILRVTGLQAAPRLEGAPIPDHGVVTPAAAFSVPSDQPLSG